MAYEAILLDVKDKVATITLNRPERLNAWNGQMAGELGEALGECNDNDEVRAVVVTGAGRAFCAGADLRGGRDTFGGRERRAGQAQAQTQQRRRNLLPYQIDKPVIAAINGHAVGVGLTYPMLCDIRIVAENAKLQFAFVRRGVIPELASHVTVARVVGFSNAADLLLTGRIVLGKEAAELGLASQALPADQVLPAALEKARDVANAAPVSVAISKRLLWESLSPSIEEMQRREGPLFAWTGNQPDSREGVVSFLEKRAPEWKLSVARDKPELLTQKS